MSYQELQGVQEARFTVAFTGRESQNIAVMWFRDGVTLHDTPEHQITTVFSEELMNGSTTIYFPEMDRGNGGMYRVVARTDFGEDVIDIAHRRQEQSFQVEVRGRQKSPLVERLCENNSSCLFQCLLRTQLGLRQQW